MKYHLLAFNSLKGAMLKVKRASEVKTLEDSGYMASYWPGPPAAMIIRIPGPIFSLNLDLHGAIPLDRAAYASNREWWRGEMEAALATCTKAWQPFERAGLIVTEAGCDLDNIGIKTMVDTLKTFRIIRDDGLENIPFILVRRSPDGQPLIEIVIVSAQEVEEKLERLYIELTKPFGCQKMPEMEAILGI